MVTKSRKTLKLLLLFQTYTSHQGPFIKKRSMFSSQNCPIVTRFSIQNCFLIGQQPAACLAHINRKPFVDIQKDVLSKLFHFFCLILQSNTNIVNTYLKKIILFVHSRLKCLGGVPVL